MKFILDSDDDTYIYGDLEFSAEFKDGILIEPYVRIENESRYVKYYKSKNMFIVYENECISEIIFTMTCWSDDYKAYKIKDNIAYSYTEVYHGRVVKQNVECSDDFNQFIVENQL